LEPVGPRGDELDELAAELAAGAHLLHARELSLRTSERRYRTIVETSQEGIWTVDTENKTNFVNRRMAEMLGYGVEDMIGQSVFVFMEPEDAAVAAAGLERKQQ